METTRISQMIDRILTGDPWHGPSVQRILDDLPWEAAARQPPGGAHSIWQLVLHMTGWAREVDARLHGRPAQEPEAGDFPDVGEPSAERWEAAKETLFAVHRVLAATVTRLDAATLDRPVVDYRDDALGTGLSHYLTLHGIIQHTVYHAGQIALLKKIVTQPVHGIISA
jgi:uncharacterized damage-inducible protein DinB